MVRILFTLASTVVATIVLALSSLTILEIYSKNYSEAPKYLVWIFVFMGVMSLIAFLKDRTKINFIKESRERKNEERSKNNIFKSKRINTR